MTEQRARILVVEDEPHSAADICAHLDVLGYEPLGPVSTATEALRWAASDPPDLVLMDVVLPGGMDGVEAAAELRRQAIPVVYITAHADDALLERAKITEPLGFLLKPYTELELQAVVVMALYRHRSERQLTEVNDRLAQIRDELERKFAERTAHLEELNRRLVQEAAERAQIEEALRESEQHLRQIIDLVPHRIFAKDATGRFLLANRAVAACYGLTPESIVGRYHQDLHADKEELACMLADDRSVIESEQPRFNIEESFTSADGRQRVLRTSKIPYKVRGEDQLAVLGMAMDITEPKLNEQRLVASEEAYRSILENAVDAIFLCDMNGRIKDANRRAGELLGYTKDELCGMTAEDLHPQEEHERLHEVFRQLANCGTTLVVHPVLRKDRQVIYCEVAATLIHYGDQAVAQGIFRDVTERRQHEAERLRQERAHRDTLIREVHHRIKNNLQGVIGLLQRHIGAHPELEHPLAAVVTQVQSIAAVHGLQGQGEDTQMRLCDMVREIIRNASVLAQGGSVPDLQLTLVQPVLVDKEEAVSVALIINELLLNAMKHCPAETDISQVRIQVSRVGEVAEVRVTNPGRLPEGFDFATSKGRGTGLALVHSLLPTPGASLEIVQAGAEVRVCLRLTAPIIGN